MFGEPGGVGIARIVKINMFRVIGRCKGPAETPQRIDLVTVSNRDLVFFNEKFRIKPSTAGSQVFMRSKALWFVVLLLIHG